jgi:IS30 family transposase
MKKRKRPRLSSQQTEQIWTGWQSGESMSHIGRQLGKDSATIFGVLRAAGGIAPQVQTRAACSLTVDEREAITRGLVAGESLRAIARSLGRSASTVSREVARNGGRGRYRAVAADQRA